MLWWVCYKKCFSKVGFWNKIFFSSPLHIEHLKLYVLLLSPRWYFPFFVFIDQKSTRFCINSHISAAISYPIPNPLKSETELFENRPPKKHRRGFRRKDLRGDGYYLLSERENQNSNFWTNCQYTLRNKCSHQTCGCPKTRKSTNGDYGKNT